MLLDDLRPPDGHYSPVYMSPSPVPPIASVSPLARDSYEDILRNVERVLQPSTSSEAFPPSVHAVELSSSNDTDGIESLLSHIELAIGSTSATQLPSVSSTPSCIDAGTIDTADQRSKAPPLYHIPKIEYASIVDEDTMLE
eukprot:jgi/Hompol1/2104/HPOL_005840-RA